jgi:peptidoglycan hydrolase CwlO-like protein
MNNNIFIKSAVVAFGAVAILAFASPVFAETNKQEQKFEKKIEKMEVKLEKAKDRLEDRSERLGDVWNNLPEDHAVIMKGNGEFHVRGAVVNSVNTAGNALNVRFFGFNRDVNVSGAKLIGGGKNITLADFQAGDKLAGRGKYDEANRTITVTEIRNLSYTNRNASDIQKRIEELLKMIRDLQAQMKNR